MSRKVMVFIVVMVSLVMVPPLSAAGRRGARSQQSTTVFSPTEIEEVTYMREAEKLARDVYLTLYETYGTAIFDNISGSEQRHMDSVKNLIDKHGLADPVQSDRIGAFTNPVFTDLYRTLVAKGLESYCQALQVGIDIEELDIEDIEATLEQIQARDVANVFNNLLSGSYNHLSAFTGQYERYDCN